MRHEKQTFPSGTHHSQQDVDRERGNQPTLNSQYRCYSLCIDSFVSASLVSVCICVHTVSDREAAASSESQRAQVCVSDASLIRVEAFISESPPWTATLSGQLCQH